MFFKRPYKGGAAVPHHKTTAEIATVAMPVPSTITIPMLQHIGVNCVPTVQKGDQVKVGQIIGDSDKPMAAPIHSSVSGTVVDIVSMLYPGGFHVPSVEIAPDGQQTLHESVRKPIWSNKAEFLALVRASGLTGLGGAGFPTHVKLNIPADREVDTLIVNAAECEPYITSDYRVMLEKTAWVVAGIRVLRDVLGFKKVLIGIEDNKPKAIEALRTTIGGDGIEVHKLPSRFPQGAEKMLIAGLTGRKVPVGKLPMDVGVVVMNVTSVAFLGEYLETGLPLIKKNVTIDGNVVAKPTNAEVLIGTHLLDVFAFAGGFSGEPCKIIMGGPMMGIAQHSLATSVVKHTNALLAFDGEMGHQESVGVCIRCARCVEACPMSLLPLELGRAAIQNRVDDLKSLDIVSCIECGSCSYVCPAKIQLVQLMRLGKAHVRTASAAAAKKGAV
jgi:electron transport complex protein RnfC